MANNDLALIEALVTGQMSELEYVGNDSDFFEVFSVENILKDKDLSFEEIELGILDGPDDGGIDSAYIFIDGELINEEPDNFDFLKRHSVIEVHYFQTKYSASFKERAIESIQRTLNDMLNLNVDLDTFDGEYNPQLLAHFELIRKIIKASVTKFPKLNIKCYYATKGNKSTIHNKCIIKGERVVEDIQATLSGSEASFTFWGAKELLEEARKQPKSTFSLVTKEGFSPDKGLYIALVELKNLYSFICNEEKQLNKSIFESNVRDYQGNVNVNKDIQNTLEEPKNEDFWWLNNGVTILGTKIFTSGKELAIENPEIVNGLQTSTEIFNFFNGSQNSEKPCRERHVLVRVICPETEESRDRIIKATNSQTKIPQVSLRGTDKIHRDIEDYFVTKGLYYDRRKNYYKNSGKPIAKIISISLLGQALMSILLHKPNVARARPSTLLSNDEEYNKLFSDKIALEVYYKCVAVLQKVDSNLKANNTIDTSVRSDLKYYVAFGVSYVVLKGMPTVNSIETLNLDLIDEDVINKVLRIVQRDYGSLGATNKVAKGNELITMVVNSINTLI